jgi:hypothetical protein
MLKRAPGTYVPRRTIWVLIVAALAMIGLVTGGIVLAEHDHASPGDSAISEALEDRTATPSTRAPLPPGTPLYVAPGGATSGDCTEAVPCGLARAFQLHARSSETLGPILLMAGNFGSVKIEANWKPATQSVTIAPAPGVTTSLSGLDVYATNVTFSGISVQGTFYLRPSATGAVLDGVDVSVKGLFLRASNTTVRHSTFHDGDTVDGIQISSGADNVLIEENTIRDYKQNGPKGYHADCIQIFDVSNVMVRRNRMANCYNSAMTLSVGNHKGIKNLTIESNFLQGCVVHDDRCSGNGSVLDLREPSATGLVVRNNTVLSGTVRLGDRSDMVFDRNIVDYLSDCDAKLTNSIVAHWNKGLCDTPDALLADGTGNRVATIDVKDLSTGELYPTDPSAVLISDPVGGPPPAVPTIDGQAMPADVAGATP